MKAMLNIILRVPVLFVREYKLTVHYHEHIGVPVKEIGIVAIFIVFQELGVTQFLYPFFSFQDCLPETCLFQFILNDVIWI